MFVVVAVVVLITLRGMITGEFTAKGTQNPDTMCIVSTGQGANEPFTEEGLAYEKYLMRNKIGGQHMSTFGVFLLVVLFCITQMVHWK